MRTLAALLSCLLLTACGIVWVPRAAKPLPPPAATTPSPTKAAAASRALVVESLPEGEIEDVDECPGGVCRVPKEPR